MTQAKTPLVLLPGLLCDGALWRHQCDHLSGLAETTVADLTRHDTIAAMAASVLSVAPDRFALAGLSMGGYVAQEIMRQAPDRVTRLALLDTSPYADRPEQTERRKAFIEMTRAGQFKGVTPRLMPFLIHPDRMSDYALTAEVSAMAERVGQAAFLRQQAAIMNRPDGFRDLSAIHVPTLVLCGRQDTLTPPALHEDMAGKLRDVALVFVENCGHLSTMERPEAVTAVMRYWLQR